ncbi:MAG: restriction endonuclease subunit S [Gemmataceae bacterium]|nr:restriction endonuclease subunit S [Gemmataceae bacterium]
MTNGDLPDGWEQPSLAEVSELNPPKPAPGYLPADAEVTFIPMPAVDADSGKVSAPMTRPFGKVRNGHPSFQDGDVIMAKITPCMENGKAAVVRRLSNGVGFGSTEFHVLRPSRAVLADYLYHYIRQESFRQAAAAQMTGSVGQKRVPADFLKQAELPLPPLAEQQRIVAKVEALLARVNAARQRLAKTPAILKRFRQSVLATACSGRLTADWRGQNTLGFSEALIAEIAEARSEDQNTAQSSLDNRIDGADGIVDTWALTTVGFLAEPTMRGKPYITSGSRGWADFVAPDGPYFIRSENINTEYLRLDDAIRVKPPAGPEAERTRVCEADLLLTITGNNVGRTAMVPHGCPSAHVSQHVAIIRTTRLSDVRYLWIWLRSIEHGQKQLQDYFYGYTKPGLNLEQVKNVWVALPPLPEQREIVRRVEALFKLADAIEKRVAAATARAEKLTQAILAKAFRGELVPTEAELARREGRDYEPASALLDRIRITRAETNKKPQKRAANKSAKRP